MSDDQQTPPTIPQAQASQHPFNFGPVPQFANIPDLIKGGCWCAWKPSPRAGKPGKFDKLPYGPNGILRTSEPGTWLSYDQAVALYLSNPGQYSGVGKLVLLIEDLTFIDVDGTIDSPLVEQWATYWERSPGGNGLRGISRGRVDRDIASPCEIYGGHAARFITITGDVLKPMPVADVSAQLQRYINENTRRLLAPVEAEPVPEIDDDYQLPWPYSAGQYGVIPAGCEDRSAYMQKVIATLIYNKLSREDILSFLVKSEWMTVALEHRQNKYDKAVRWIWSSILKAGVHVGPPPELPEFPSVLDSMLSGARTINDGLLDQLVRPAPTFNPEHWPPLLAAYAQQIADAVGVDPLGPAFAALWSVSAAVDKRSVIRVNPTWVEKPIIWALLIGEPSSKKSPACEPAVNILSEIEEEFAGQFDVQQQAYETAVRMFEQRHRDDDPDAVPEPPPRPVRLRLVLNDATGQGARDALSNLPRGCGIFMDEMGDFIMKQSASNTDNPDRRFWLQGYSGRLFNTHLAGRGEIRVPNLALSMLGGVQPGILAKVGRSLSVDGLMQRFMPVALSSARLPDSLDGIPPFLDRSFLWRDLIDTLVRQSAKEIAIPQDARNEMHTFFNEIDSSIQDLEQLHIDGKYVSALGKLQGMTIRTAGLFELIERPASIEVSLTSVRRAIQFVRGYLIPALAHFYFTLMGINDETWLLWLADLVISHPEEVISARDIKRSGKRRPEFETMTAQRADEFVIETMEVLERQGWVKFLADDTARRRHAWAINPELKQVYAKRKEDRLVRLKRVKDSILKGVPDVH